MPSTERLYDSGSRRGEKWLREFGEECRHARLRLGLSQRQVATAARFDRTNYSRIERGKLPHLTIVVACRIAAVLGLDLWLKVFPGSRSIRDAAQARRLMAVLSCVAPPLSYRVDVPLPSNGDRPDQRAWDAMLFGVGERTGVECELRLYDLQAQLRRFQLKMRDDSVDHFLLVIADTPSNRRVLAEFGDLLAGLPRVRTDFVVRELRAGRHPPTGLILVGTRHLKALAPGPR